MSGFPLFVMFGPLHFFTLYFLHIFLIAQHNQYQRTSTWALNISLICAIASLFVLIAGAMIGFSEFPTMTSAPVR